MAITLRDGSLGRLSALVLVFATYVAGDRAFIETVIWPGAFTASRIVSVGSSFLIFAAWLAFTAFSLDLRTFAPRFARVVGWAVLTLVAFALLATVEILLGVRAVRILLPYAGLLTLGAVAVSAVLVLRRAPARGAIYLLCWSPALAGGLLRMMLDVVPNLSAHPLRVNAVYIGATLSLTLFGIIAPLGVQARERRLRAEAVASEARLRSFADSVSDLFWETDAAGDVRFLSSSTAILQAGAGLVEQLRAGALGAEGGDIDAIERAIRAGQAFRGVIVPFRGEDGATRYLAFSGRPSPIEDRERGYLGTMADVTQERAIADRVAQQQKMAALGQLAGGISHEINNLLHPIINLAKRVRDGMRGDDRSRYQMDIIVDAGLRASEIVTAVLASVRADPRRGDKAPMGEAIRRGLEVVRPICRRPSICMSTWRTWRPPRCRSAKRCRSSATSSATPFRRAAARVASRSRSAARAPARSFCASWTKAPAWTRRRAGEPSNRSSPPRR
jgi:signal transduction histidine kinase